MSTCTRKLCVDKKDRATCCTSASCSALLTTSSSSNWMDEYFNFESASIQLRTPRLNEARTKPKKTRTERKKRLTMSDKPNLFKLISNKRAPCIICSDSEDEDKIKIFSLACRRIVIED
jgi:hypothetical protein